MKESGKLKLKNVTKGACISVEGCSFVFDNYLE